MEKLDKRSPLSSAYQEFFFEVRAGELQWNSFSNNDSMSAQLNPWQYSEELLELQDELNKLFWQLAETTLTDRQFEIIKLACTDLTQMEMADKLHVNRSSITKSLFGNKDYVKQKTYGGAVPKMKKYIKKNKEIQELLVKINELQEEIF